MESPNEILDELRMVSPFIAGMEKVNVFTVPSGYFDGLANRLLNQVQEGAVSFLKDMSRQNAQEVPGGYFEGLPEIILNRIRTQHDLSAAEELKQLSKALYSIQGENVFEVPGDYFKGLAGKILDRLQPEKVVVMRSRSSNFTRYAVAAVFTGIITLGVFRFIAPVLGPDAQPPSYVTAGLQIRNNNVDEELAKVSDDDIIRYLQSNNEDFDAQAVANTMLEENELPNQVDYLMDDKALDKYLNGINPDDLKN